MKTICIVAGTWHQLSSISDYMERVLPGAKLEKFGSSSEWSNFLKDNMDAMKKRPKDWLIVTGAALPDTRPINTIDELGGHALIEDLCAHNLSCPVVLVSSGKNEDYWTGRSPDIYKGRILYDTARDMTSDFRKVLNDCNA